MEWFKDWFDTKYYHILYKNRDHWGKKFLNVEILGDDTLLPELLEAGVLSFIVGVGGVGDNQLRIDLFEQGVRHGLEPMIVQHAAAVLSEAKHEGAKIIVSACNLSHTVLDVYQGKASQATGLSTNIPVIHLTEMLAFVLGHHNDRLAQLRTRVAFIGD